MRNVRIASRALALACALGIAPGCFMLRTQVWPSPMSGPTGDDLPPDPSPHLPGPEEATVHRHADPVQYRPAGALSGYPLPFFDKKVRANAGSAVMVAAGGRAEVLWPSGASVVMFDQAIGWIGSPSRGEPLFELQEVDRAQLLLRPGDSVRLMGGAVLSGESGPYWIQRIRNDVLRVKNQSKANVVIAYRDEVIDLVPGQMVNLPLVSTGTAPSNEAIDAQRVGGKGFNVLVQGKGSAERVGSSVEVKAQGPAEVTGMGVRVKLEDGESARWRSLGDEDEPPPPTTPAPANAPVPESNAGAIERTPQ